MIKGVRRHGVAFSFGRRCALRAQRRVESEAPPPPECPLAHSSSGPAFCTERRGVHTWPSAIRSQTPSVNNQAREDRHRMPLSTSSAKTSPSATNSHIKRLASVAAHASASSCSGAVNATSRTQNELDPTGQRSIPRLKNGCTRRPPPAPGSCSAGESRPDADRARERLVGGEQRIVAESARSPLRSRTRAGVAVKALVMNDDRR